MRKETIKNLLTDGGYKQPDNKVVISESGNNFTFVSYGTTIAKHLRETNKTLIGSYWNYSRTTRRYLIKFLNEYCGLTEVFGIKDLRNLRVNKNVEFTKLF